MTKIARHKTQMKVLGKNQSKYKRHIDAYAAYYIMLLPVLLYFIIFKYLPMYGIVIAFKDYYPLKGFSGSEWVGFKHFKTMFSGMYFLPVLKNTLIINIYKLVWGFPAPIILAIILNEIRHPKFKKTAQTISYLPHFLSWVIVAGLFKEILSPSRGVVNYVLSLMHIKPIFFMASTEWFRTVLVGAGIWQGIGWGSIIYMAAISNIDPNLYEAASMDGAKRLQKIRHITLPSIKSVIIIMLIFALGKIINDNFQQIYNFLNLKVYSVGDVISTYTYEQGLKQMRFSYSTAVGLFKTVVSFFMIITSNKIAKKLSGTGIW